MERKENKNEEGKGKERKREEARGKRRREFATDKM